MPKNLRDVFITCRYELVDSIRSRRALVILVLYLLAAVLSCNSLINVLQQIEQDLLKALQLPTTGATGSVTETLWQSERFRDMISHMIGDKSIAAGLTAFSPIVLIYAVMAFFYTPLLAVLTAAPRIADEVMTGSVRYVAFRTSRLSWCMGKWLGLGCLMLLALLLNALGAWTVAVLRVTGVDAWGLASGMIVFCLRAWLYTLPFIGLALGVSQFTRSGNQAVAVGLSVITVMTILYWLSIRFGKPDGLHQLWYLAQWLSPQGHRLDLWRQDWAHLASASVYLLALGLGYLMIGHARFARRDL